MATTQTTDETVSDDGQDSTIEHVASPDPEWSDDKFRETGRYRY